MIVEKERALMVPTLQDTKPQADFVAPLRACRQVGKGCTWYAVNNAGIMCWSRLCFFTSKYGKYEKAPIAINSVRLFPYFPEKSRANLRALTTNFLNVAYFGHHRTMSPLGGMSGSTRPSLLFQLHYLPPTSTVLCLVWS